MSGLRKEDRDKKIEELTTALDEYRLQVKQIQEMQKTPGWIVVASLMEAQVRARRVADFENDMGTLDKIIKAIGDRGALGGMQLAFNFPKIIIDDLRGNMATLQAELDDLLAEQREEEDDGR